MGKIGFTTTIPFEVPYVAGRTAVDLNNIFITDEHPVSLTEYSENAGLPTNLCSWIKGIYAALHKRPDIDTVIAVVAGDCSNTLPLVDILRNEGLNIIPFSYPFDRDEELLRIELERFASIFGVTIEDAERVMPELDEVRALAHEIDYMTWHDGTVTGFENHFYLVNCSDFTGDPKAYAAEMVRFISEAKKRTPVTDKLPLAYIGVPPIFSDFYDYLELHGAKIVYNETQRQFSMPFPHSGLVERYRQYTYPYSLTFRLQDIVREIEMRGIRGVLHYTQSFCHHQMDSVLLKKALPVPILNIEGDRPGRVDERTALRIESFIEMLE